MYFFHNYINCDVYQHIPIMRDVRIVQKHIRSALQPSVFVIHYYIGFDEHRRSITQLCFIG